jgi:hypothetical protein
MFIHMSDLHLGHLKEDNTERMKRMWTPFGWGQLISKRKPSAADRSGRQPRGAKGKVRKW